MADQVATVAISGYYGFGNAGDEAVLAGIVRSFAERCPKAKLAALSADPAATEDVHGIRAVHRMSLGEVIGVLREADLLLSGGGSLLQNVTSTRSLLYYLGIMWLAKRLGKKVMVYAQGAGPLLGRGARRATRYVLNKVDLITVRDEQSRLCLEELGVKGPEIRVTADPSFAVEPEPAEKADESLSAAGAPADVPLVGVSLRPWRDQLHWLPALARGLDSAADRIGAALVFLPMQLDQDLGMSVQMASEMRSRSVVVAERLSPARALAVMGRMSLVVGMRLHALIFAGSMGVPFAGIAYDPKVESFVRSAIREEPLTLDGLDAARAAAWVIEAWEKRGQLADRLAAAIPPIKAAALENASLACALIGG